LKSSLFRIKNVAGDANYIEKNQASKNALVAWQDENNKKFALKYRILINSFFKYHINYLYGEIYLEY